MKKIKVTIGGMHCAACASNVERALRKVKGINEINVSLMVNKGFLEAEDYVTETEIRTAVEEAGFKVINFA